MAWGVEKQARKLCEALLRRADARLMGKGHPHNGVVALTLMEVAGAIAETFEIEVPGLPKQ